MPWNRRDIMNKYIDENKIKCPNCGEHTAYVIATDEIEFNIDGTGHYFIDCACDHCDEAFRKYYYFKYEVTSESES